MKHFWRELLMFVPSMMVCKMEKVENLSDILCVEAFISEKVHYFTVGDIYITLYHLYLFLIDKNISKYVLRFTSGIWYRREPPTLMLH